MTCFDIHFILDPSKNYQSIHLLPKSLRKNIQTLQQLTPFTDKQIKIRNNLNTFKQIKTEIQMGQSLCSSTSQIVTENQLFLEFQFGEDQKQGKVEHDENIKYKNFLNLDIIIASCIEKLKASKYMYKDPSMPTDRIILRQISKQNNQKKQIQASFLKPYKFLNDGQKGKTYKVFPSSDSHSDYILVKDEVMQYFGVFLCFLADHPKIVSEIILTESSTFGLLAVKLNLSGKQQVVYMDDYILCTSQGPVFSQPIKNIYLWPNIIQKAWLKITGFTQKVIEKSSPQQVFETFLNYPYKKFYLQQLEEPAAKIYLQRYLYKTEKQYGYILTTKKQPKIHIGISGKKYLYLIGSFYFQQKRMFYIRNACGRFNFRGQYDEISEQLKIKIRETFNVVGIQEGNFILQESQFLEQISQFAICYYSPFLKPTSIAIQLENNSQILIQTQLKNASNVSLCFRQQSARKTQTKFSPITYQIFNMTTGQLFSGQQNNEGCFGFHNAYLFPQVIKKLTQSKYLIRLKKKDKKKHYFGIESMLMACSSMQMKFDMKNQSQFSQLFKEYLKKEGKKNLSKSISNNQTSKKSSINPIAHIVFLVGDLICIYIEYTSSRQQQFKIEISFPELNNLELIYPEINLKQTSVLPNTLGPLNKQEIIVFQKIDLTGETELGYFQLEAF